MTWEKSINDDMEHGEKGSTHGEAKVTKDTNGVQQK
jgi:hypothetical protein